MKSLLLRGSTPRSSSP